MSDADAHRPPPVPPGWNACLPARLPLPTASPALFAFGVTLFGWGLITSPFLVLIGGALLFYALLHWTGEIWHDAR
jgi:hypothetical protein